MQTTIFELQKKVWIAKKKFELTKKCLNCNKISSSRTYHLHFIQRDLLRWWFDLKSWLIRLDHLRKSIFSPALLFGRPLSMFEVANLGYNNVVLLKFKDFPTQSKANVRTFFCAINTKSLFSLTFTISLSLSFTLVISHHSL